METFQITPLSYDQHESLYGGGVESFTLYCLGYWLQQNRHREGDKDYEHLRGMYAGQQEA